MTQLFDAPSAPVAHQAPFVGTAPAPPLTARLVAFIVIFVLSYDVPINWFKPPTFADPTQTTPGPPPAQGYVAAILLLGCGFAAVHMVNRLDYFFVLIAREPLLPAFIGLAVASMLWSQYPFQTLRFSISLSLIVIFGYWLSSQFRLEELLAIICIAFAFGTIFHFVFIFGLPQYGDSPAGWVGVGTIKNDLGRQAALAGLHFLLAAGVFRRFRLLWLSFFALAAIQVFFSQSSTGIGTLALLMVLLLVFKTFRARKTLYGAVAVGLVGSIALTVLIITQNLVFVTGLFGKDITFTGRTQLWQLSLIEGRSKPWFGHGWGGFWQGWFSPAHPVLTETTWRPPHAHNALIDYFLTLGVIGAAMAAALMLRFIVRSTRAIRFRPGTLGVWPLSFASFAMLSSVTEFGVITRDIQFLLLVVLVTIVTAERRDLAGTTKQRLAIEREIESDMGDITRPDGSPIGTN